MGLIMTRTKSLPSVEALKAQAKKLRAELTDISHTRALELVAHQWGYRDWNTLAALAGQMAGQMPNTHSYQLGDRVNGLYLGRNFSGEIIAAQRLGAGQTKLTIRFDEPVDVVSFESFSSFRSRVSATINKDGKTAARTSDGAPHMQLYAG